MNNIKDLQNEAAKYPSEIARVKAGFKAVAAKEPITDPTVLKVMEKNGYVEFMPRAKRHQLTEKGKNFYRQMKKFGNLV